ncbi:MAG: hypothetical protein VYB34_05215 [Planctomycetota bacterium]|nr:hypothetical protein [Planctomycetota bacterium]
MPLNAHQPDPAPKAEPGFTLLELIISVTLLTLFVVPIGQALNDARIRSIRYTQARQVKSLAQQKLHDRINVRPEEGELELPEGEGDFEEEGHPSWSWIVDPPQPRSQGEQVVLEYTITVEVPFQLENGNSDSALSTEGSSYQYTTWTFPNEAWYETQEYLFDNGMESLLYGNPDYYNEALPTANTGAGR